MNTLNNSQSNESEDSENVYLSKILLFTNDTQNVIKKLKNLSNATVTSNCINTIGMYPLISRIDTPLGKLNMSIWVISLDERFSQFRLSFYSGASHSIILCKNQEEFDNINDVYTITPTGVPTTFIRQVANEDSDAEENQCMHFVTHANESLENQRQVFYQTINELTDLIGVFNDIGRKIADDIISGEFSTFTPQFVKQKNVYKLYNKRSFEKVRSLISKLGYDLLDNGQVIIPKDGFTFEIDFYRNQVKATMTSCLTCEKACKHFRRLCVIEEDQGYSNFIHFDNLRALAILYSIHDNEFKSLTGNHQREDISYQLQKIRTLFEINCVFEQEEKQFLEISTKMKSKKSK